MDNVVDAPGLLARFAVDLALALVLVRGIYHRRHRGTDLFPTFLLFNTCIFLITYLLNRVDMTLGAAFGLFAAFSMLRYRTENLSARDMTYIFVLVALGLIIAVAPVGLWQLIGVGAIPVGLTLILELGLLAPRTRAQRVEYDRLDLLRPEQREALLADLQERTGLDAYRVETDVVNFALKSARLTVYYREH